MEDEPEMKREFWLVLLILAMAAGAAWLVAYQPANAQGPQGGPTTSPEQVNAVAKDLWCPLCNGVRLDNCDLQACVQMREVISQKIAAGQSNDQIKSYFVQQYGEVVLGMPKSQLPFILPFVIGILALGFVGYFVVVWVRRRPAAAQADARSARSHSGDDYLRRVDEELKKYH